MSLINQVLKDLEKRQRLEAADAAAVMTNMHYVPTRSGKRMPTMKWLVMSVLVAAAVGSSVWWWQYRITETVAAPPVVSLPAPVAVPMPPAAPIVVAPVPEAVTTAPVVALPIEKPVVTHKPKHKVVIEVPPVEESNIVKKQAVTPSADEQTALVYQQAYDLIAQQRLRDAEAMLRQALTADPTQVRLRELLTGLYIKSGRWVEAEQLLANGMQHSPVHVPFLSLRARALMQLNQDNRAIELLKSHTAILEQQPELHALLAALYQRQQQHSQAAAIYTQLLGKHPKAGVWWVGLGISQEALGKQAEAQHSYQQARASGNLNQDVIRYTDQRLRSLEELGLVNN